ncbi:hypothetical protein M0R72_02710 [Candidatus Pacearchaeota archaeon]|jgi:hypothetical protein|nr:hypothetical protein [Candidatus Pacearchaeota archaeon]
MTTIKRQGYPDITDEDLKPISEILLEMTPITPVRHERKGPMPVVLPDLIAYQLLECNGVGVVNPRGLIGAPKIVKTVIVGDEDD